jgi:hypothetical protein
MVHRVQPKGGKPQASRKRELGSRRESQGRRAVDSWQAARSLVQAVGQKSVATQGAKIRARDQARGAPGRRDVHGGGRRVQDLRAGVSGVRRRFLG